VTATMAPIPIDTAALIRSLYCILPELVVIAAAAAVLLADLFLPETRKKVLCGIGIAGVLAAIGAALWLGSGKIEGFSGMIVHDGMGLFSTLTILGVVLLTLMMATGYAEWEGTQKGEFYALLLLSAAGMLFMAKGTDLMTVFLGLETMSIPIYCLVGFHRNRMTSLEGALKYFLLGAFASGFLLYGIALMYFVTGTTKIAPLAAMARDLGLLSNPVFLAGMGLLLVGFGFKVSLAPFHMWTPDAYEGAPTLVTAFMGAAVKAAAFAALIRVALLTFPAIAPATTDVLWVLAVLTMTVGNFSALLQDNVKRMLAYSSIAHAGYILVGLVAGDVAGGQAALFYLLVYAFMNLGAFGVIMLVAQREDDGYDIRHFAGIGFRYPVLGALLSLFLVSLAGIPPTAGFVGKFYLFSAAVKNGYVGLAVLGVLNSAVSVYYYLRLVVYMYMTPAAGEIPVPRPPRTAFSLALCASAAAVLVLGVVPRALLDFAERSILSLLM
jgi:NADH-quinone oxidoreductase subunit N